MDKLLSVGQVAKRLRVSVDVVRSLDERGELKGRRTPGGHRRYLPADVDRVIARLRAGRSSAQTRALRSPAPRRPPTSPHERRPPEPDDFDVEEDVPDIEELEANERAAAETKARAAAADAERERLEGLKKYGRDLAVWLPTEWQARVIEDLEDSVTSKHVPPSLALWPSLGTTDRQEAHRLAIEFIREIEKGKKINLAEPLTLEKLWHSYQQEAPSYRGNLERTRKQKQTDVRLLIAGLGATKRVEHLTKNDVERYVAMRRTGHGWPDGRETKPVRARTIQGEIKQLRQMIYWAMSERLPDGSWLSRTIRYAA